MCRSCALRRKRSPAVTRLQPQLRVRSLFGNDFLRVGWVGGWVGVCRGSEGGHVHVPARSTAGPARTAKWLVLKVVGGPGARCSPASSSSLSLALFLWQRLQRFIEEDTERVEVCHAFLLIGAMKSYQTTHLHSSLRVRLDSKLHDTNNFRFVLKLIFFFT